MLRVDLNCDMGEGCPNDAELMPYITSANIACGFHAGGDETMRTTARLALENGVRIGAHPGYRDRENFGRKPVGISAKEVAEIVSEQVHAMSEAAKQEGGTLSHVKPHGALYNQAAIDPEIAAAVAEAIRAVDSELVLFGLSGSLSIAAAEKAGLRAASEVFADRTYQPDKTLTSRSLPNALIHDAGVAAMQALDMVKYGRVRSVEAIMLKIKADTICLHGDSPDALTFAQVIHSTLVSNGVDLAPV